MWIVIPSVQRTCQYIVRRSGAGLLGGEVLFLQRIGLQHCGDGAVGLFSGRDVICLVGRDPLEL